MNCKYTYKGKMFSYDNLLKHILETENSINKNLDVLYSMSEQETIVDNFNKLKKKNSSSNFDTISPGKDFDFGGDPMEKENELKQHFTHFFDNPIFTELNGGNLVIPRKNDEDFIKNRALILREKDENLTEEQALELAKKESDGFYLQKIDSFILHNLIRNIPSDPTMTNVISQIETIIKDYGSYENVTERCEAIKNNPKLLQNILSFQKQLSIEHVKGATNSKVIYNIPLYKKLKTENGEIEIFDQIDRVVVRADDSVEIYKIKISEENTTNWPDEKRIKNPKVEKYRLELAFIKVILEDLKIFSGKKREKVSLHLLTLQTNYNHDDNLSLESVSPYPRHIQMDMWNGEVQMGKHMRIARNIIQPDLQIDMEGAIESINKDLNRIWNGKNILVEASNDSVDSWIEKNKNKAIKKIHSLPGEEQFNYKIRWKGTDYFIKEDTKIEENKEIRKVVEELLEENSTNSRTVSNNLQKVIYQVYETKDPAKAYINPEDLRGFSPEVRNNIIEILQPYLKTSFNSRGEAIFDWELVKNNELSDYNFLIFRHKSGQMDIVDITNLNLDAKVKFNKGDNLAGCYLADIDARQLPSTWANIEAIKTMTILNHLIPSITGNFKLGNIKIITTFGSARQKVYSIQHLMQKYYSPLMKIVYQNTKSEGEIKNNFGSCSFIDKYQTLIGELQNLTEGNSLSKISQLAEKVQKLGENVSAAESVKIDLLLNLGKDITEQYYGSGISIESLIKKYEATENSAFQPIPLQILFKINATISQLRQQTVQDFSFISKIDRKVFVTRAIASNNFKTVLKFYNDASQKINDEAYEIGLEINEITQQFYKDCGYSGFQNKTWGNQTAQFSNLYEDNDQMQFKNPYDPANNLKDYERKFLKKALLIFAKYRYMNNGMTLSFTNPDSDEVKEFVRKNESWYFNCPLKKTSGHSLENLGYRIKHTREFVNKIITDPKLWAKEFFTDEELKDYIQQSKSAQDVTQLRLVNMFSKGETSLEEGFTSSDSRENYLTLHEDTRYFEHNVENLLRDFSFEAIRVQNMTKMMFASKLFLLQMHLTKRENLDIDKDFNSEIQYIQDFLKHNVFSIPLMEESEYHLSKIILPMRNLVRKIFLMGNFSGEVRDITEGFGQMMARAIVNFQTDIKPKDVLSAYATVTKEAIENTFSGKTKAGIISLLCIKYRLSNIDVSNVAEGQKTGNKGLNHWQDELFRTLKDPDFLNRMVLFVAKCKHDGCWDAFYLDKDGHLAYDWKKDKRFNLLAANNKNNLEEYNKQKSLFYSLIKIWNDDHPNAQTDYNTLPMPYSEKQIENLRHLADNIWGAYDKSTKALGEHSLLMMTFGMFTTWMNGQIENYFKKLQESTDQFELEQATDFNGNLLFFKEDGTITTNETEWPVWNEVPIMVQGIWQTLVQMGRTFINPDGSVKRDVLSNKVNQDNMKKLATDATMTLIYYLLIRMMLQAFKDKQEELVDPHDYFTNAVCEVLYKGMYSAWDGFQGPYNLIKYLGESTNPPMYQEGIALSADLFKVITGDMSILAYGSRHFAPMRPFKQTIKLADKERKKEEGK